MRQVSIDKVPAHIRTFQTMTLNKSLTRITLVIIQWSTSARNYQENTKSDYQRGRQQMREPIFTMACCSACITLIRSSNSLSIVRANMTQNELFRKYFGRTQSNIWFNLLLFLSERKILYNLYFLAETLSWWQKKLKLQ
jgi:hypothetical protein